MPSQADRDLDIRQSPVGFFNLGLSYILAGDELTRAHLDALDTFRLAFDHPIKHLYAHGWELCLKACIFQQGVLPSAMKHTIGHRLTLAWDAVDKARFAELVLTPETRQLVELLDAYHPTKLYAYPVTGARTDFSIEFVRASSKRFELDRPTIGSMFASSMHSIG